MRKSWFAASLLLIMNEKHFNSFQWKKMEGIISKQFQWEQWIIEIIFLDVDRKIYRNRKRKNRNWEKNSFLLLLRLNMLTNWLQICMVYKFTIVETSLKIKVTRIMVTTIVAPNTNYMVIPYWLETIWFDSDYYFCIKLY